MAAQHFPFQDPVIGFFHAFLLSCIRQKVSLCAQKLLVAFRTDCVHLLCILSDCFAQRLLERAYLVFPLWAYYTILSEL